MKTLQIFVDNYRNATNGFNLLVKILIAFILAFIFIAVVFAIVGIIPDFFGY